MLIISSSPRKDGVVSQALLLLRQRMFNYAIKEYNLYDFEPLPCIACGYCEYENGCSQKDLDVFFEDFEDADLLIFASPVYNNFFPSPMKALIDRFQRYFNARFKRGAKPPISKPKAAGLLAVSGSYCPRSVDYMKDTLEQSFTVLNTRLASVCYFDSTDNEQFKIKNSKIEKFCEELNNSQV